MDFEEARQWDEAEQHYRESARIEEEHGNLAGAAVTWNHLAIVSENAGKPAAAEMWYRKAIEAMQRESSGDCGAKALSNLANLLQTQPGRLSEARQLAEEALAIKRTLDPGAAAVKGGRLHSTSRVRIRRTHLAPLASRFERKGKPGAFFKPQNLFAE